VKLLRGFRRFAEGGTLPEWEPSGDEVPVLLSKHLSPIAEESEPECPCWPDCLEDRE
jgi:hypothetical protein